MQLNDLIKEYTMRDIAKKTNIAEGVIAKLSKKDFSTLKKPQALGAISIIEREYAVDLDPLRQECKEYFLNNDNSEGGLTVIRPIAKERRFFPKFLSLLLLAALVYGAWYFFVEYYNQRINPMNPHSESSFIEAILPGGDTDASVSATEQNSTEKSVQNSAKREKNLADGKKLNTAGRESISADEANRYTMEYYVGNSRNETKPEAKKSGVNPTSTEQNAGTESAGVEDGTREGNSTDKTASAAIGRERMALLPKKAMWFALTNAETRKTTEFKRQNRYDIDLRKNAWLLATENAQFSIIDNDLFEEFGSKGKLFFRLDKTGIHPLSEDEYKAAVK